MSITTSEIVSFFTLGLSIGVMVFVILKLRVGAKSRPAVHNVGETLELEGVIEEFTERLRRLEERLMDESVKLELVELRSKRYGGRVEEEVAGDKGLDVSYEGRSSAEEFSGSVKSLEEGVGSLLQGTELRVLRFVMEKVSVSGPMVEQEIGKSREHTARVLNSLFGRGLLRRDERSRPYKYSITERGKEVAVGR
jgi:hypothetical protein